MSNRELRALGYVVGYDGRLRSGRDTVDPPSTDSIGSEEIRQLREQLAEARTGI